MVNDTASPDILDLINKAAENAVAGAATAKAGINQIQSGMQQSTDSLLTNILGGTNQGKTPLALETELQASLEAQQKNRALYDALNNNQGFPALMQEQMGIFQDKLTKAQQLAQSVEDRESVGFFDNPLGFIVNQLYLPDERNALKATLDSANVAKQRIADTNQLMQASAISENAFKQSLSAAANQSLVEAMQKDIGAKADAAAITSAQTGARMVMDVYQLDAAQLEARRAQQNAQATEQNLEIARTAEAERKARFDDWLRQSAENVDFNNQATRWYNLAAAEAKRPRLTSAKISSLLKLGGPNAESAKNLIFMGQTIEETGRTNFGATPWTALKTLASLRYDINDPNRPAGDVIGGAWYGAAQTAGEQAAQAKNLASIKDPIVLERAYNEAAIKSFKENQPVRFSNTENPFIVQAPTAFLDTTPAAIENTKLWTDVLKPAVASGALKTSNPSVLVDYAISAVQDKKISLGDAAQGIVTYYNSAMQLNNEIRQFEKLGFPPQTQYTVVTDTLRPGVNRFLPAGVAGKTFNFTDLTDVNAYMISRASARVNSNLPADTIPELK